MAGRLVHFELPVGDMARGQDFWRSLFGWEFSQWDGPVTYSLINTGGEPGGGMYPTDSPERGVIVYFGVDDLDTALERVRELGGRVVEGKAPVPGVGWYARCSDTEANSFSLFQNDESAG